jgi:hypothetical protein
VVGVFLNDGSGAKLDYYLRGTAALAAGSCQPDGRSVLHLHLTLRSTAPASGLSPYVTGLAMSGNPYVLRTNVSIFSPAEGVVADMSVDGVPTAYGSGAEGNRSVAVLTVDLPPGATRTVDVELWTAPLPDHPQEVRPALWVTPLVEPWTMATSSHKGCQNAP